MKIFQESKEPLDASFAIADGTRLTCVLQVLDENYNVKDIDFSKLNLNEPIYVEVHCESVRKRACDKLEDLEYYNFIPSVASMPDHWSRSRTWYQKMTIAHFFNEAFNSFALKQKEDKLFYPPLLAAD